MSLGRDLLALTRLLPGVVKDGEGSSGLNTQGAGTVAGIRESSNAVSIDGVLGNPRGDGNKLDTPIAMDSVAEIKVMLNAYQAEYGGSAGAIITAYYYGQNEAFNANGFFDNREGNPRGRYRYNTYGYNVGGPIYIPGLFKRNKDKLFFFFSQKRWPTKTNSGYQRYMMPTEAERKGDFSNTYDTKERKVYILLGGFFSFVLLPVMLKEVTGRQDFYTLTQVGREMSIITGDQILYAAGKGNLKKWLAIRIGKGIGKRGRGHGLATVLNVIKKGDKLVFLKTKPGTM